MTDTTAPAMAGRTPWHFWAVAILALLWNCYGAYDYVMTQTENTGYLAMFTPEQVEYFTTMPLWLEIVWAVGIWSAVIAAILFILRRAWAVWLFALSLLMVIVSTVYSFSSAEARAIMTTMTMVFSLIVPIVAIFEYFYSQAMRRRGVLR